SLRTYIIINWTELIQRKVSVSFIENEKHVVYILKCKDRSFYTGYTNDFLKRIKAHNNGKGAKYTRGRGPSKAVFIEEHPTKQEAMQREYEIKQLSRKEKIALIQAQLKEVMTYANSEEL